MMDVKDKKTRRERIGIFGGTFDPVHIGHLLAAESACEDLGLEKLYFIPAYDPPHKAGRVRNVDDRLQMLKLAVADNQRFEIDPREIQSGGISYTLNTVRAIQQEHPYALLYMIIGEDSMIYLKSWYCWQDLLDRVELVVVRRPMKENHFDQVKEELEELGHSIHVVDKALLDLSSEEIRHFVAEGRSIRYMVPESVRQYICEKGLYREKGKEGDDG